MHLFQVDLTAEKPVCGGPRSKMWQVKCSQCKTEYQIFNFPFVELRLGTLQIE